MRNTYLIDFENVGSDGLAGVTALTSEDRVIIFYSANSSRMTLRAHQQIVASAAQFDYFEVTVGGKNALDHQLGTYLGYMVATNASERYFIVSHDNGFKFLSAFWLAQDNTLQIALAENIKVSLRTRSTDRTRVAQAVHPVETAPLPAAAPDAETGISMAEPAPQAPVIVPERLDRPVAETTEAPAPVAETPIAEPQPGAEPTPAAQPEPVVQATEPVSPAEPMPALGSQSRSRNTRRSRIRSESILATLPTAHANAPAEPEVKPAAASVAAPASEPTAKPAEAEPMAEPAAQELAAHAEPAAPLTDAKPEIRRSRSRRGRSRQNPQAQRPAASKAAEQQPAEAKSEPKQDAKAEPKHEPKQDAKTEPKHEPKQDAKTEPKREQAPEAVELKPEIIEAVNALLQPFPKISATRVRELIALSKKQVLCNMLRRQMGQEQGLALYNQIKRAAWK